MYMILFLLRFWPLLLALAGGLGAYLGVKTIEQRAYSRGYETRAEEERADARRRLDNTEKAEEEARRCALDPDCRLATDPYLRKDE